MIRTAVVRWRKLGDGCTIWHSPRLLGSSLCLLYGLLKANSAFACHLCLASDSQAASSGQQDQQCTKDQLQVQLQQPQQQQLQLQHPPAGSGSRSWRHRLRHLLCCVAPPPQGPPGCSAADLQLVNTLYQLPPQPPRVYREAVIGPKAPQDVHKKTLVLDLDETLVHSSFKPIPNPDYIIPVEIDGRLVDVYVLKRPWLDHFLNAVSKNRAGGSARAAAPVQQSRQRGGGRHQDAAAGPLGAIRARVLACEAWRAPAQCTAGTLPLTHCRFLAWPALHMH